MAKEREIKLRVEDLAAMRRALRRLGARVMRPRLYEGNVLFDTPEFDLAKREQLLRIRTERSPAGGRGSRSRATLTLKRPVSATRADSEGDRHNVREEMELEVPDGEALARILEGLGMRGWFRYEKFRTTFRLPEAQAWAKGLLLELDETPIGIFLELEGPAGAIDRAARSLGFEEEDYILANYMELYRESCQRRGEEPGDMVFGKEKRHAFSTRSKHFS